MIAASGRRRAFFQGIWKDLIPKHPVSTIKIDPVNSNILTINFTVG